MGQALIRVSHKIKGSINLMILFPFIITMNIAIGKYRLSRIGDK